MPVTRSRSTTAPPPLPTTTLPDTHPPFPMTTRELRPRLHSRVPSRTSRRSSHTPGLNNISDLGEASGSGSVMLRELETMQQPPDMGSLVMQSTLDEVRDRAGMPMSRLRESEHMQASAGMQGRPRPMVVWPEASHTRNRRRHDREQSHPPIAHFPSPPIRRPSTPEREDVIDVDVYAANNASSSTAPAQTHAGSSREAGPSTSTSSSVRPKTTPQLLSTPPGPSAPSTSATTSNPLSSYTCPICFSPPTNATLTPCGHVCCGVCLFTAVKATLQRGAMMMGGGIEQGNLPRCPVCRATIPGWDGVGGGVIGLRPRVVFSL